MSLRDIGGWRSRIRDPPPFRQAAESKKAAPVSGFF
jgi:hypothetical protein